MFTWAAVAELTLSEISKDSLPVTMNPLSGTARRSTQSSSSDSRNLT